MKTPNYILVLLFFTLPLLSKAQNDSIVLNNETSTFKSELDLDVHFLGGEFNYSYNISSKISIGGGVFLGYSPVFVIEKVKNEQFYDPINNVTYGSDNTFFRGNAYLEKMSIKIFIRNKFSTKISVHIAFKSTLFHDEVLSSTSYNALECGVFYKIKKIELGLKPSLGNNEGRFMFGIPLFIVKINLSKW